MDDIMEITGNANSKIILTSNSVFGNSSSVFFEYYDVLKAPWFGLLDAIVNAGITDQLIDTRELKSKNISDLFTWYVMRKHRNFLLDLPFYKNELIENGIDTREKLIEWCDKFLYKEMVLISLKF